MPARQTWTLVMLLLAPLAAQAAPPPPGQWISGKGPAGKNGDGEYKLYVPASHTGSPAPLVVMLHGCSQDPNIFAESTRMNSHAESGRFLVLYPAQPFSANPARCWNWFLPENQARDSGEPARIVALVEQVARSYPVDRKRIYVAGLSAGASMAGTLAACYPDVFAAAAMQGGTMYKSATTLFEAGKVMTTGKTPDPLQLGTEAWACGGRRSLPMPVAVWHGQGDNVVNRDNAESIVRQFSKYNDWADDGQENGSTPQPPVSQAGQVKDGHAYSVARYQHRGQPLLEYYQINEMGHAWSGGKDDMLFSDGKGPDASLLIWNFFRQHSR